MERPIMPSDFIGNSPWDSRFNNVEIEVVAHNIMKILSRTGNTWRTLEWEEYVTERLRDIEERGIIAHENSLVGEKTPFNIALDYCSSAEKAMSFSPNWIIKLENVNNGAKKA